MTTRDFDIATDVGALLIFEPDGLTNHADDEIAWYASDGGYQRESADGRLIVWETGADGGYRVRVTTEPHQLPVAPGVSVTYRLRVSGRWLLLDNSDALPGEEQQTDPADLRDQWFEVEPGDYRVDVALVDLEAANETGVAPGDLPEYIVSLTPTTDLETIRVLPRPPRLAPGAEPVTADIQLSSREQAYARPRQATPEDLAAHAGRAWPVLADGTFLGPWIPRSFLVSSDFGLASYMGPCVIVAASGEEGAIGTLGRVQEVRNLTGDPDTNTVTAAPVGLVRIGAGEPGTQGIWHAPAAAPYAPPAERSPAITVEELAVLIAGSGVPLQGMGRAKVKRQRAIDEVLSFYTLEGMSAWLIDHLELPGEQKFELVAQSVADRLDRLVPLLR